MTLAQEDIEFIKDHLREWLGELELTPPSAPLGKELLEQMVR
ncbi:hypothetical protein Nhal_3268 [Nitrosococcus halophilus Nc 4]|uniref:Uncharacterized protein n=1 Tax=Nitrosococcus halophilus (strain Nc4) TaxID=472759 RepID=D5C0J2_NITHN|nr:hypothetical protein [Nitrosococcus halophilus]ADE16315.1 hypothetical protein Nhal_3268 [Nitrosococcus halophilus Nc 4]